MPLTVHAQAKAPHMLFICGANVIAGVIQLATGTQPNNILHTAPQYVASVWSFLLITGGITVLIGAFIRSAVTGLMIEAAGHIGMIGGCLIYVVAAVLWLDSPWASSATWWAGAIAIASAIRWLQVHFVLSKAKRTTARRARLRKEA